MVRRFWHRHPIWARACSAAYFRAMPQPTRSLAQSCLWTALAGLLVMVSRDELAFLVRSRAVATGGAAWWHGCYLTFCLTGIWAFLGFAWPTHRLLPASYYEAGRPELWRGLYRWLGVRYFGWLLVQTLYRPSARGKTFFNGRREGLAGFEAMTRESEFGHVAAGVLVLAAAAWLAAVGRLAVAGAMLVCNLVLNFYPIVLQREHRRRLVRCRGRVAG